MKMTEDIKKIIENDLFFLEEDDLENFLAGPCWGIKVDREAKRVLFTVDSKEVLSCAMSRVKSPLNRERLSSLLKTLRRGDLKQLRKELEA
jgi:hypothetical protein